MAVTARPKTATAHPPLATWPPCSSNKDRPSPPVTAGYAWPWIRTKTFCHPSIVSCAVIASKRLWPIPPMPLLWLLLPPPQPPPPPRRQRLTHRLTAALHRDRSGSGACIANTVPHTIVPNGLCVIPARSRMCTIPLKHGNVVIRWCVAIFRRGSNAIWPPSFKHHGRGLGDAVRTGKPPLDASVWSILLVGSDASSLDVPPLQKDRPAARPHCSGQRRHHHPQSAPPPLPSRRPVGLPPPPLPQDVPSLNRKTVSLSPTTCSCCWIKWRHVLSPKKIEPVDGPKSRIVPWDFQECNANIVEARLDLDGTSQPPPVPLHRPIPIATYTTTSSNAAVVRNMSVTN